MVPPPTPTDGLRRGCLIFWVGNLGHGKLGALWGLPWQTALEPGREEAVCSSRWEKLGNGGYLGAALADRNAFPSLQQPPCCNKAPQYGRLLVQEDIWHFIANHRFCANHLVLWFAQKNVKSWFKPCPTYVVPSNPMISMLQWRPLLLLFHFKLQATDNSWSCSGVYFLCFLLYLW